MKYLIIGAGGTGGALGAYLTRAGRDVTLIARGANLEAMRENGIKVTGVNGDFTVKPVKCLEKDSYNECLT